MSKISIVVPVWNEEGNLETLVHRIHASLKARATYEIIFIDDHSTDGSIAVLQQLSKDYPIVIRTKKGEKGKAQSIIEGLNYARYPLVAMIDADLQYPPEAIAKMMNIIKKGGFDIVVGNRLENHTPMHRKLMHDVCRITLGKILHNLDVDIQSGLKVFRREVANALPVVPSAWAFDLEFLVYARNAGYTIGSCDIVFDKRHSGSPKINLVEGTWQITVSALRLKFKRFPQVVYSYD